VIIAIINQKGGVGKTTTTINLGAALARQGSKVLLLDLDDQRSLSQFRVPENMASSMDIQAVSPKELPKVVKKHSYDYVLLDCPPVLAEAAAAALKIADIAIAPTPPRFLDVAGFALLRQTVQEAANRVNSGLGLKILLTQRDSRAQVHADYEAKLRSAFRSEMLHTTIPRSIVFDRAADAREPIVSFDGRSVGAKAYLDLATEIQEIYKQLKK
jgi:chromosome partitioning protein